MLGVQPLERLASRAKPPNISLLWRALLEVLLNNSKVEPSSRKVGRIAAKCGNFLQFVRKAEGKIHFESNLSDEEIQNFFVENQEKYQKKLVSFYQYRALFSLLI